MRGALARGTAFVQRRRTDWDGKRIGMVKRNGPLEVIQFPRDIHRVAIAYGLLPNVSAHSWAGPEGIFSQASDGSKFRGQVT
jgi:hypothetical protein